MLQITCYYRGCSFKGQLEYLFLVSLSIGSWQPFQIQGIMTSYSSFALLDLCCMYFGNTVCSEQQIARCHSPHQWKALVIIIFSSSMFSEGCALFSLSLSAIANMKCFTNAIKECVAQWDLRYISLSMLSNSSIALNLQYNSDDSKSISIFFLVSVSLGLLTTDF